MRCPYFLRRTQFENVSRHASLNRKKKIILAEFWSAYSRIFFTMQDSMNDYREKKVQKFEEFVDLHLKPDLVRAIAQRDKVFEQQKIFSDLRKNIETLQKNSVTSLKTLVNLGSEVYMQAEVPDTQHIFVDIGLGFHVEFTWSEALKFIQLREAKMARKIEEYTDLIASIKAQIKLVCEGIRELLQLSAEVQDRDDRVF